MGSNTSTSTTLLSGKLYPVLIWQRNVLARLVISSVSQPLQLAIIAHISCQIVPCVVIYTTSVTLSSVHFPLFPLVALFLGAG